MKKILTITLLVIAIVSCKRNYETLLSVDNIIEQKPDSAFVILSAIDPADLFWEKDRAYYALLYTQAQYKTKKCISDDSLISIATDYYEDSNDDKMLARSYMYKGCVNKDLGMSRYAMELLKKAEMLGDTTDYLTIGLLNTRIAELYQQSYGEDEEDINRHKKALKYYNLSGHDKFVNYTLGVIGQLYILRNRDSAELYINSAVKLAKERGDSVALLDEMSILSLSYQYDENYVAAKDYSMTILKNTKNSTLLNNSFYRTAFSYLKLGKIDSAKYYLNKFTIKYDVDSLRLYIIKDELAKVNGDYKSAYHYNKIATQFADSVAQARRKDDLYRIEKQFDNKIIKEKADQLENQLRIRNFWIIIITLLSLLVVGFTYIYWLRKKKSLDEKNKLIDQLQVELDAHEGYNYNTLDKDVITTISSLSQSLEEKKHTENILYGIAENRIRDMKELISILHQYQSNPSKFFNEFTRFITQNSDNRISSDELIMVANRLNNNAIDVLVNQNSEIDYDDMVLMSLLCLDFNSAEICKYLGKSSLSSTYTLKSRLKNKLGSQSYNLLLQYGRRFRRYKS